MPADIFKDYNMQFILKTLTAYPNHFIVSKRASSSYETSAKVRQVVVNCRSIIYELYGSLCQSHN